MAQAVHDVRQREVDGVCMDLQLLTHCCAAFAMCAPLLYWTAVCTAHGTCSGGGSCNTENGDCVCAPKFFGANCSIFLPPSTVVTKTIDNYKTV